MDLEKKRGKTDRNHNTWKEKGKERTKIMTRTQKIIYKEAGCLLESIQFFLGEHHLWCVGQHGSYQSVVLGEMWDQSCGTMISEDLKDGQLAFGLYSPCGYHIGVNSWLVEDCRGRKLLWLPPNWRRGWNGDIKWDGNFLALLSSHYPEPIRGGQNSKTGPILAPDSEPILAVVNRGKSTPNLTTPCIYPILTQFCC